MPLKFLFWLILTNSSISFSQDFDLKTTYIANDFKITLLNTKTKSVKTAGFYLKDGHIQVFEQSDILRIWNQYKLQDILPGSEPATHENGGSYGGLRKTFYFRNDFFALIPIKSQNCFFVSLINLSKKNVVLKAPCLPENEEPKVIENYDFNAIGGGHAEFEGGLLLALGAPSVYQPKIADLSQNDDSPYGKILYFSSDALLVPPPEK